jgi:hypothetical protein
LDNCFRWPLLPVFRDTNYTLEMIICFEFLANYWFHPFTSFGQHPIEDSDNIYQVNNLQVAQREQQHFTEQSADGHVQSCAVWTLQYTANQDYEVNIWRYSMAGCTEYNYILTSLQVGFAMHWVTQHDRSYQSIAWQI